MVDDTLYYKYNLARLIKDKTGEEPNLERIRKTVDRWLGRMAEDAKGTCWEEIGRKVPLEFLTPRKEGWSVECGLWSLDELERRRDLDGREAGRLEDRLVGMLPQGEGSSPVDIDTRKAARVLLGRMGFPDLFLDGELRVRNTGETMSVKLSWPAYFIHDTISCAYQFKNLHFHWSDSSDTGTEHAIDGKRYALEAHMVFGSPCCSGRPRSLRKKRFGTAVISLMFKESESAPFYQVFSYCEQVRRAGKEVLVSGNVLKDFTEALSGGGYYNYSGSFTTPPYTGGVNWFVLKTVLPVHRNQLAALRSLEGEDRGPIQDIVRTLFPLDKRVVLASVDTLEDRLVLDYALK